MAAPSLLSGLLDSGLFVRSAAVRVHEALAQEGFLTMQSLATLTRDDVAFLVPVERASLFAIKNAVTDGLPIEKSVLDRLLAAPKWTPEVRARASPPRSELTRAQWRLGRRSFRCVFPPWGPVRAAARARALMRPRQWRRRVRTACLTFKVQCLQGNNARTRLIRLASAAQGHAGAHSARHQAPMGSASRVV